MTTQQLHDLLEAVPDTREIVVACPYEDGLIAAWRAARRTRRTRWTPGAHGRAADAFAAYRAAQDRADAAQDALVAQAA